MPRIHVKIDDEVLKFKDSRVSQLLSAKLSVQGFALSIVPGDPFVLIGDTVYALTENEYYAMRASLPSNRMTEANFKYILNMEDISFMSENDQQLVRRVVKELPGCSACTYKRYKNEILGLIGKYGIKLPDSNSILPPKEVRDVPEYPETIKPVVKKVSHLLSGMYTLPAMERMSCMDCVEKHLSQAYILGNEALMGYPEHLYLMVGHMGEAIEEMPKQLEAVRSTVEFCLACTNAYRKPFLPLWLLTSLLALARRETFRLADNHGGHDPAADMSLDITDDIKKELGALDGPAKQRLKDHCEAADKFIPGVSNDDSGRILWEGAMALAADCAAQLAPLTANMIRNRRLMFVACPELVGEYKLADVAACLDGKRV